VLARALDAWWAELGRPDPYVVIEAGAGVGTLAAAVLAADPECATALRYVTVERSPSLRAEQRGRLALEEPAFVLGVSEHPEEDEEARPRPGQGPLVTALAELPALAVEGVILANELLDNLGFRLLEQGGDGWREVLVGEHDGRLREVLVPAPPDLGVAADELAPDAPPGGRVPLQRQAQDWVATAVGLLQRGRVVVIDYADRTASLARRPWEDWLRTYRGHGRGGHPLSSPGTQDVTCEVAVDQLLGVAAPLAVRSQAEFLASHGMGDLAAEAAAEWEAGAARGDLGSVRARSRVGEARALAAADGLGAFAVVEWDVARRQDRVARS
jgi:SAM-dependent MidA family methyltransferase